MVLRWWSFLFYNGRIICNIIVLRNRLVDSYLEIEFVTAQSKCKVDVGKFVKVNLIDLQS